MILNLINRQPSYSIAKGIRWVTVSPLSSCITSIDLNYVVKASDALKNIDRTI